MRFKGGEDKWSEVDFKGCQLNEVGDFELLNCLPPQNLTRRLILPMNRHFWGGSGIDSALSFRHCFVWNDLITK